MNNDKQPQHEERNTLLPLRKFVDQAFSRPVGTPLIVVSQRLPAESLYSKRDCLHLCFRKDSVDSTL
jgi:hypothetical protein